MTREEIKSVAEPNEQAHEIEIKANEAVIAKAVLDPEFREALIDDPEQALSEAGIELSPEDRERIVSLSREEREEIMQQLESRQAALGDIQIHFHY
jgi:hypothetical protein